MSTREEPSSRVLFLCTGNATRSVLGGAALAARRNDVRVETAGTLVIEGRPMSPRTRAGFAVIELDPPSHRSRQASEALLARHDLVVAMAPEHVSWVRREHPGAAARTATLKRLARDLASDDRPLADRLAELRLDQVELETWEEIIDPGGGETDAFVACAIEIDALIDRLVRRL